MPSNQKTAKMGSRLKIHYICKDDDGNVLESTLSAPPPEIRLGNGDVLDALEKAFCGMVPGQVKKVHLKPEEAFGEYDPDLVDEVPIKDLQLDSEPKIGMELEFDEDGETYSGIITDVTDEVVCIDANHPLAGVNLNFELALVEIL